MLPVWLKLAHAAFLAILIPVYWFHYGPANFLWFSDIALILLLPALWLENALLVSMIALAVLVPEIAWNIDFLFQLITGHQLLGLASYMFEPGWPLRLRLLSLFHVPLPPLLIYLLARLRYDRRALYLQTLLAWMVLPASWLLAGPQKNINFVHGLGAPQSWLPPAIYLLALMAAVPLIIYLPTHLLLLKYFRRSASPPPGRQ